MLESLAEKGFGKEQLDEIKRIIDAENSDIFDVLSFIRFAFPAISRSERVSQHKGQIYSHYDYKQQAFLEFVLNQYVKEGVEELDQSKLPSFLQLKYGGVGDAAAELGSVANIREVFVSFQQYLYCEN